MLDYFFDDLFDLWAPFWTSWALLGPLGETLAAQNAYKANFFLNLELLGPSLGGSGTPLGSLGRPMGAQVAPKRRPGGSFGSILEIQIVSETEKADFQKSLFFQRKNTHFSLLG